jgi:glycosyltransferase involved in cell wall biosynthesis
MIVRNIAVTAMPLFLRRYRFLYDAIADHVDSVQLVSGGDLSSSAIVNRMAVLAKGALSRLSMATANRLFEHNPRVFVTRSRRSEEKLAQLAVRPDLIFHVFGMFSPVWNRIDLPYVMYLDYTLALAAENYPVWAPSQRRGRRERWLMHERQTYLRAATLFTMSECAKKSLVRDYAIPTERVHVVGASGMFKRPNAARKAFGTQQILFNGTDFDRKGGALVIEAFRNLRRTMPSARLVVLGQVKLPRVPGIEHAGFVSSPERLERIFQDTDLVVAPGQCDPFPSFVIEAMNYGIPCIVSDRDGMPEIVDNGLNGVVLRRPDANQLSLEIQRLLNAPDLLQAFSRHAKDKVRRRLNWSTVGADIAQCLARL